MAIFSEGGTSYPDILIVCYMIICSVISSLLNPAVFIYNYWRKKNSVPVFLFRCLAVFDFLTCIFIPVKVATEAVKQECFISIDDDRNKSLNCVNRMEVVKMNSNILSKLYSLVAWVLILVPNFIAAIMAICRFIQIRFPFYPLELKHLTIPALVYGAYTLCLSGYVAFHSDSVYQMDMQIRTNNLGMPLKKAYLAVFVFVWPSMVCQILSVVTSILTILHLYKTGRQPIAEQSTVISRKSSLKILLLNFGSVLNNIAMIFCMTVVAKHVRVGDEASVVQFFTAVLAPVLLSCFNPIVFIMFTPSFGLTSRTQPSGKEPAFSVTRQSIQFSQKTV